MALSGRIVNTTLGTWNVNVETVVLDIPASSGMIRLLAGKGNHTGSSGNQAFNLKIDVDGVTIFNDVMYKVTASGNGGIGFGVPQGTSNVTSLVNIPFAKSVKLTLINKSGYQYSLLEFMCSYVIDLQ